jgi:probable rRNA maturation factor
LIDVEIEADDWTRALPEAEALVQRAAQAVLDHEKQPGGATVLMTDDAAVQDLNARFRQQDKPTNVLSFPTAANPEHHLGDIALAYGTCAREAHEQKKTLGDHLQHLVAHGVLHLLGYDHMTDAEAEEMEGLEREVLASLGIADPYASGEGDHG